MLRALYGDVPPLEAYPTSQHRAIEERLRELPLRDPTRPAESPSRA